MKKKTFNQEEINKMVVMYTEEYKGTPTIGEVFNCSKTVINRILRENGVGLGQSGRKWTGGKKVASKKWDDKNKEHKKGYMKQWYQDNKEYRKEYHQKWRDENRETLNEYKRVYEKTKKDNDPHYKLSCYTRTAIYTCLKERNIEKYSNTFDLLPYNLTQLVEHLESQFTEGMTWDNYGDWHVDHIKPMNSFDFTEDGDFGVCWSLSNLQPLWAEENLSKGSRYLLLL